MNFDYQLTATDEKYFLKERHRKTNLIYFILFALFFLAINFPMIINNFTVFAILYILFICLLGIVLYICNAIFTFIEIKMRQKNRKEGYAKYHFSITKRGITQSVKDVKIEVLWKDIKKVCIRKNYVFIEPKRNAIAFLFQKRTLGEKYPKAIEAIKQNMKVYQGKK